MRPPPGAGIAPGALARGPARARGGALPLPARARGAPGALPTLAWPRGVWGPLAAPCARGLSAAAARVQAVAREPAEKRGRGAGQRQALHELRTELVRAQTVRSDVSHLSSARRL